MICFFYLLLFLPGSFRSQLCQLLLQAENRTRKMFICTYVKICLYLYIDRFSVWIPKMARKRVIRKCLMFVRDVIAYYHMMVSA